MTKNYNDFTLFFFINTLYVLLSTFGPLDPATLIRYDITTFNARLINATVVLPLAVIFFSAFYAFKTFKSYARVIRHSIEGESFKDITIGLKFLAFSLPVNALFAAIVAIIVIKHPQNLPILTALRNYSNVAFILSAFVYLSNGARKLALTLKDTTNLDDPRYWPVILIAMSCSFGWLIISRPDPATTAEMIYGLPNWLVIFTVAIPYLYAWFRGILGAYYMFFYLSHVKGTLYKKALSSLSRGIIVVTVLNVTIQFLVAISPRLNKLHLTPILTIIYVMIATYALGFGLIGYGAKKLKKIEEV